MEYQIEFAYSSRLAAKVARSYWLSRQGASYMCYIGVPLLTFLFCLTSTEITSSRGGVFFVGVLFGISATFSYLFLYYFFGFGKSASKMAKRWDGIKLTYKFNEENIVADSNQGAGVYPWTGLTALRRQPLAWMLFYSEDDYTLLPTDFLTEEIKQLIMRKGSEIGTKVI